MTIELNRKLINSQLVKLICKQKQTNEKLFKVLLSEKHTKFEKNLPHGFDKSAYLLSKHQNLEEDFFSNYVCFSKSPNFKITESFGSCDTIFLHSLGISFYDFTTFSMDLS